MVALNALQSTQRAKFVCAVVAATVSGSGDPDQVVHTFLILSQISMTTGLRTAIVCGSEGNCTGRPKKVAP